MSYTLYYKPGACSMAMHVILNELNVPFEAVKQDDLKAPDFLKLNPRGQVPLLIVDGEPVKEGAAIITYLPVTLGANVKRVLKDVSSRPAYQKTLAAEQIEYKAAA